MKYSERRLEDDYPIHAGYMYVLVTEHVEDKGEQTDIVIKSTTTCTALELLSALRVAYEEASTNLQPLFIKNCDIAGRKLWENMV